MSNAFSSRGGQRRFDLALLVLRLSLGGTLLITGMLKLLPWSRTVGFFESIGAPAPAVSATVNLLIEIAGGTLLLLGVAVPVGAALAVLDTVAILTPVNLALDAGADWWMAAALKLAPALALWLMGPGTLALSSIGAEPGRTGPSR